MGINISIAQGRAPDYYTKQMGQHSGADYYLSPVDKGGESQGTWIGEGLADLGVHDGDLRQRAGSHVRLVMRSVRDHRDRPGA